MESKKRNEIVTALSAKEPIIIDLEIESFTGNYANGELNINCNWEAQNLNSGSDYATD